MLWLFNRVVALTIAPRKLLREFENYHNASHLSQKQIASDRVVPTATA